CSPASTTPLPQLSGPPPVPLELELELALEEEDELEALELAVAPPAPPGPTVVELAIVSSPPAPPLPGGSVSAVAHADAHAATVARMKQVVFMRFARRNRRMGHQA